MKLPDFKQEDIEKNIFGLPDQLNIYTAAAPARRSEILWYVGQNFIEYDINSLSGCVGAVVILLDKNQPPSVEEAGHGKAVSIHSGAHPTIILPSLDRNYGFLSMNNTLFSRVYDYCWLTT